MKREGRGGRWWLGTIGANVVLVVLLLTALLEETSCSWDTSYCAYGDELTQYRGHVFTPEGRPLATRYSYYLETLEGDTRTFTTDAQGRYCLEMPTERITPTVTAELAPSTLSVDPRFQTPRGQATLAAARDYDPPAPIVMHPPSGAIPTQPRPPAYDLREGEIWRDDLDSAATCERPGRMAPWYRYDDLHGAGQAWLLRLLPLAGVLGLWVVAGSRLRHAPWARWVPLAAFAVAAIDFLALVELHDLM